MKKNEKMPFLAHFGHLGPFWDQYFKTYLLLQFLSKNAEILNFSSVFQIETSVGPFFRYFFHFLSNIFFSYPFWPKWQNFVNFDHIWAHKYFFRKNIQKTAREKFLISPLVINSKFQTPNLKTVGGDSFLMSDGMEKCKNRENCS